MKVTRRFRFRPCRSHRASQPSAAFLWAASYRAFLVFACLGAFSGWALGPAVSTLTPGPVTNNAAVSTLTLGFTQVLDPARASSAAAYEVLNLGANRAVGGGDDTTVAVTPAYTEGTLLVALTTPAPLVEGRYRITAKSDPTNGVRNLAAEYLDQDQDGTPDDYVGYLDVDLTPPAVSAVAAGTCLVYDDGYDMVTLPHEALNGLAAYTLELWFQTTKTNGQSLISAIQSGNTAAVQFWLTNGVLYVESASSSVTATLDGVYDGRWHHLAVTYSDAADRMEIIYDGRLLTSAGYTGGPPTVASGAFIVGQEQDAPAGAMDAGQAFSGALTELRLWDHARSRAEVDAMRFQRAAGDEAGLRACWHFDEGTTVVPDATGNGFDGVLSDWQGGDLPRWQPAVAWWNEHRTLYVTYLDIGGMDAASVQDTANYTVLASGGDGGFEDGNEVDLTAGLQSVTYVPATRGAVLAFDATLPQDMVRVTIRGTATVRDAAGHALLGGNDYVSAGVPVALGLPPLTAVVAPTTDTGFSDTDGITSQALSGFEVTVDQAGTIAVDSARNGSWEAVREVTAAGSWRVDAITPFPEGAHTVPVRFASWLGAVSTTSVALTVDTTPPQVSAVEAGTALNFDGSNDYVVTTAKTWGFTTSATLAAWVKTTDDSGTLISLAHGDVNNELLLLVADGKVQVIQHRQPGSYWYRTGTSVINLGRWVHVAAVFDGTGIGGMRVFVNGIEEPLGTTGQAGSPAAVSDATPRWVALGARLRNGSRSELLAGQIDEAQVWSRALTPAEIAALVATAPVGNELGLAGLWRLNEGVGTTVVDAVAGCNGTFGADVAAESPTWAAAPLPGPRRTLRITYSENHAMDEASVLDVGNYLLTASGGDGVFGNGNDVDRSADLVDLSYDAAARTATLRSDPAIAGDAFRLTVRGTTTIRDAAGNALAGGEDVVSDPVGIPAVPPQVTAALDPASDGGLDNGDRLTGDTTPALQVTVTDRGLIEIYLDGVAVPGWSQAVATAGTVALTPPEALPQGFQRVTVVFTPWIGEATQTTLDLFIDAGGPRVTAVDAHVPTPCRSRTVHFSRPVRTADLSPAHVTIRAGNDSLLGTATAVTPLWTGLKQNPGTGTWYLPVLRREGITWFEAEAEARRLGGALVSIADGNEMTFVSSLVTDVSFWRHVPGAPSIGPWIGLRREAGVAGASVHWYWPDSAAMVYTNWGSNQPDNRDGQHWAVHLGDDYARWYDNAPTTLAPGFIVEFAVPPVYASSFRIDVASLPGGADYSLAFGPGVRDTAGNPMDQDDDGTPGEAEVDGWVDAFTVPAPADGLQIVQALPTGADPAAPFRHLEVVFSRPVDAGSIAGADAVLTPAGGGAAMVAASFIAADSQRWLLDFGAGATGSAYDLAIGPQVTADGIAMDQDRDGTSGEALDDVFRARLQKSNLTLSAGNNALDDIHLVLWSGAHVSDGAHRFAGLFVLNGAVLSHSPCTADEVFGIDLEVTGTVQIDATSAIDVTNRGYLPGRTHGNLPAVPALGAASGSHGGLGRTGTSGGSVPPAYGNFAEPDEPGGGGNQTAGGGLVRLEAGAILIDGRIVAHGGDCGGTSSASAGAGGGVLIRTGLLGGTGLIGADGGAGTGGYYGYYGGSGGGGRVALYYDALAGFDPVTQARAVSRNFPIGPGAAGTVFLQPSGGASQLRIDSQGTPVGQTTPLLASDGGDIVVDTLVVVGSGVLAETPPGVGVVAGDVAILDGAVLTHAACTADQTSRLDLTVSDTLLIDAASAIDVTNRGYRPGRGQGNQPHVPELGAAGASHGGLGRTGTSGGSVPAAYGDFTDPGEPGGGGAQTAGGGLVRIQAGTALIDGRIVAHGGDCTGTSSTTAGAGGGILLNTELLSGSGLIGADGGAGTGGYYGYYGGSGGGGRVAIYYEDADGFDLANRVTAHSRQGGSGSGSMGTVYLKPEGGTSELRVVSHGTPVSSWTPLLPGPDGWVRLGSLTIAGAGVEVAAMGGAPISCVDVSLLDGARLTHMPCTDTAVRTLDLAVSGTLLVDPTSAIDASGRGYLPGRSVGNQPPTPAQGSFGGSHGGLGRIGSSGGTVPATYDDLRDPALPGGGGSGTAGGGVVRIHAATIVLEGAIRANGVSGWSGVSGGAGGSVRVQTGVLSGAGSVTADGGAAGMGDYASTGGSGGGGRVAIYYGSLDGFDVASRVSAHSAASPAGPGSAGTVYLQPEGGVSELRIVSHGTAAGAWTPLLPGPDGWVRLGSLTIAGAGVEVAAVGGAPIGCVDIAVLDGANLTHPAPSATATFALEVHATGTVHVDALSRIDVSGRGCPGGTTLGVRALGSSKSRSGGSYGGKGYGNASNTLYGRPDNPLWPGSGGDTAGGGLVRLHATATVIDGAIRANGTNGIPRVILVAGSGGGILINTVDWSGEGTVEALGGNGNWGDYGSNGGSGGGGRIAVYVGGDQAVSVPALSAAGGTGGSGPGGDGTAVLYTAPSFFWTDPRPAVGGPEVSLGWELLGAPAGTTIDLSAGPAGGDQAPLAADLPAVGSFLWDTSALPSGLYSLRLAYGEAGGPVVGESTRTVLVHQEGILHGGRLESDQTWAAGVLHVVSDDLEIPSGVTLTVAAGALVKVADGRTLRVLSGGAVVSEGTPGTLAVFTSLRDDSLGGDDNADGALTAPAPGDWGGIRVDDGTALPASDSMVQRYGTHEHGGTLAESTVWPADTLHWVRDDVSVPAGMPLTVDPGATVVFDYGRVLWVSGTLQAIGAIGAPIRMTSSYDSAAIGMAYGPYAGHTPAPGNWQSVFVSEGGVGTFDRVHFRYGAGRQTGYDSTAMVRGRRSTLVLQNCRIEDTQYDGVLVDWALESSHVQVNNCVVTGCDIGFRGMGNAAGVCQVVNSSFYGNRIGIQLDWGSASYPRVVRNSIIAGSREIGFHIWGGGMVLESNNVWGSGTTNYSGGMADPTGQNGNLSADPRFRDPALGDLNLMPTSPCIDAANGTYAPATDFAGLPRNDFPRVADTGVPMPGDGVVPDMGAHEYSQHVNTNIDLVVAAVRGPTLATAGEAVTLSWEVTNQGTEEVSGWRRDRVGLSTAVQQRGEVSLTCGTAAFTDTIRPGQTVTYEAVVTVPGGTPGVWNWSVTTNAFDDVAEGANRVNNTGLSAGTVTLGLPTLVLNAPTALSGQLAAAGATAWYAVTVPAGQDAIVRVDAGAGDARLRLYAGRGFLPTVYDYDWQSPASGADPRLALPASSGEQTLYILVVAEDLPSGPTTFTATAAELVFALDACDRRSGGNAGNTTVRLTGAGFTPDLAVGLRGAGGTIPAAEVTVLNSGEAYAVLDLNGVATGVYDVVAQVGGLESALTGAFTVTAGKGWDFSCRVTAPKLVRPDRPFPVLIEFENTGDSDCPPILVTVTNDGGFPIWRSRRLPSSLLSVAAVAPNGPTPGYLRPGERGTVAAWSVTNNVMCNYTIAWRSTYCQEAIDWDAVETALCPCINPHWDELWPAFKAAVGTVDGDYIAAAAEAVAEARRYGVVLIDNLEIFQWLLDRQEYALDSAAVTGQVRRQGSDEPVGRVEMTLLPRAGGEAVVGQTWHDGRFAFWDVPEGPYDVRVEGVYGGDLLSLEVPPGGVLRDAVLLMPAGGAMAGTITDAVTGEPVAAAAIDIRDPLSGVGAQALTDAEGRYHVSGLPPNAVVVQVLPVEHAPLVAEVPGLVAGATLAWNAVVQPGATVFGVVTAPGGATVAGATILAAPTDGSPGRSGLSAEDGSYEVRGLAPGTYRLEVRCKGYGAGVVDGVGVPAAGNVERDLALTTPGTLQGRVVDGVSGSPIEGVEVAVSSSSALEPILSAADGHFAVGSLPIGEVIVTLSAEGYLPHTAVVTIGAKEGLEVALQRPWSLTGRILDGVEPVAGLRLYLQSASGDNAEASTAEDGTYLVEGLRGGDWTLVASGPVGEILIHDSFSLTSAEKDVRKDYALARGQIRGRILTAGGTALAGAEVRLARGGSTMAETTSGDDGRFELEMVPGVYDVSVVHRDVGVAKRVSLSVGSGAVVDLGDWSPAGAGLAVTATDGAAPLAGAVAELVWLTGLGGERLIAHGDAAGHVAFSHLAPGTYRLNASAPGRARLSQAVVIAAADVAVTAVLPVEGVVAGRVRAEDGTAVPFALVWASDLSAGETLLTLANAAGEYRLEGLPAQPVSVWVTDHVLTPSTFAATPVPGAVTEVDVVLPAGGAYILGHLVNPLGLSVGGVRCAVLTPTGIEVRSTATGTDGLVVLGPLPDGDFTMVCNVPGLQPVLTPVTISGADVDLGDVLFDEAPATGGAGGGGKGIWDWVHGQTPPKRHTIDRPYWRTLQQVYWNAYVASGKDCPDAPEAYRQASLSSQSINTRYDAWCLAYAAMSGMTGAELNTLAAEIGILTGKISMQIAGLSGAMETMKGPEFLAKISPDMPAELVKGYNDLSFAIDFVIDSTTRLVACLNSGEIDASEVAFDQMIATVQAMVGAAETVAKIIKEAGTAGSTSTFLAGGALGKTLGVLGTIKDLYGYWKGLKEKEKNILDTIKANERANEMYNDMLQRHTGNLARLQAAIGCGDDDDPPPPPPPPPPPWPPPPPGGFPEGGDGPGTAVGRVLSRDPNAKESLGVGAANWVTGDRAITYIVYFENEDDATAPAQTVTVTDVFDANLDLESFEALQVSFNGTTIDLPAGSRSFLGTGTVASDPYPVRIRVDLNTATRTATWTLQSYDPATGELPTDPLAGFLPPNDDTGRGEGFVMFRLAPVAGLPTGTQIRNVARIVFDENEPIMTNQIDPHDPTQGTSPDKEALATLDIEAPASAVAGLDALSPPGIVVSWAGRDDLAGVEGSGAATYTVYVQDNGGPFTPWLTDTPLTTETYSGEAGHTYGFYSIATDAVGWQEAPKAAAEASTVAAYTVQFEAGPNGSVEGATTQYVAPGGQTSAVEAAAGEGYHFVAWMQGGQVYSQERLLVISGVNADLTFTAEFEINQYTVTFRAGEHGSLPGGVPTITVTVNHGDQAPAAPAVTASAGWEFAGWSDALPQTITADAETTALYARITHTVTFLPGEHGTLPGGVPMIMATLNYGDDPASVVPAVTAAEGWEFTGWSPTLPETITANVTTTAQYVRITRTVTFLAGEHGSLPGGVPMVTVTVNHGDQAPVAPAVTPSAGWEFTGWSDALPQTITADVETTALYARITHTVTFLPGEHGTLPGGVPMIMATLNYGDDPASVVPAVTAAEGWEFTGWSPALPGTVTENVTTTAQYARTTRTVTFFPGAHGSLPGGVPMVTVTVNHGSDPASVAPAITPVAGWLFTGWSPALPGAVTADLTTTAQYAAAGAVAPDGPFHAEVDATAAAAGAGIWVLTGDYPTTTTTLGSYGLALRLTHDSRGRVSGDGTFLPDPVGAPAYGIPLAVRGSVKGSAGAMLVKLTLKGQRVGTPGDAEARARVTITLTAALNVEQKALLGSTLVALSMGADRQSTTPACRIDLPPDVDGTYALDVDLARVGKTLRGTATLTLAARTPYRLLATGRYSNPHSVLRLSGASGDPAAGGIKLGATILTLEDRSATILDLSGTAFGQSVRWSP